MAIRRHLVVHFLIVLGAVVSAQAAKPQDYSIMTGTARIANFGEDQIAIVIAPASDRSMRHFFKLQLDHPILPVDIRVRAASIEFRGDELIVMSADDQIFYRFGLSNGSNPALRVPADFKSVSYVGYGLSHDLANVATSRSARGPTSFAACGEDPDSSCVEYPDWWYALNGGGGGTSCSQGGPGASSCSLSGTVNGTGMNCSVTCWPGYYACCSLTNGCKCVRDSQ
jgi:hypothetical protein